MTLRDEVPGDKIVSVEPCKYNIQYSTELKKTEISWNKRLKQFLKKFWAFRSEVTVEPYIVCYMLPSILGAFAVQNLCLEKSCLVDLHYDERTCSHIMQGRTQNYTKQEENIQIKVSKMTAWNFPVQTGLPGILVLFLGAWSDRTGKRKVFMVLPIIGKFISTTGIILSTVFFLDVGMNETALLDGLPPALLGGRAAMNMAVFSYITDITSVSERTFRIGIISAIMTLLRPIGMALSGIMVNRLGYYGVFSIAFVFYLIGFVYIVLRLKEKTKKTKDGESEKTPSILTAFSVSDIVATLCVAFRVREGSRRLQMILIILAYMLIAGPVMGELQMTYWFTRHKFQFTEVDYSLFLTYSVVVGSIGSVITIYLLSKRWHIDDSIIGVVACLSRIGASMVYALAPTSTIFYLGPMLDMFSSAGITSLRSIASKLVNADEVGKISSIISVSEALVPAIYSPVYSKVYLATLSTMPGAFYLISSGLAVPAIGLLM